MYCCRIVIYLFFQHSTVKSSSCRVTLAQCGVLKQQTYSKRQRRTWLNFKKLAYEQCGNALSCLTFKVFRKGRTPAGDCKKAVNSFVPAAIGLLNISMWSLTVNIVCTSLFQKYVVLQLLYNKLPLRDNEDKLYFLLMNPRVLLV